MYCVKVAPVGGWSVLIILPLYLIHVVRGNIANYTRAMIVVDVWIAFMDKFAEKWFCVRI